MTRLQSALKLARRGHDLLEQKRKILMSELMSRMKEAKEIQAILQKANGEKTIRQYYHRTGIN